jgi:predicted regulator of Ras-like GTPase activity (Roadblock/LC7/MglB family)
MTSDQQLREACIVFYKEDVTRIDGELDGFLELSGARCALLIDSDGHLITRRGELGEETLESVAALVAGSFAATKELARLVGEEQFSSMFHQGERESIQISLAGQRSLLAVVFDDRTNMGLVRFYCQETLRRLKGILAAMEQRGQTGGGVQLSQDFSASATAALDELF